MKTLAELAIGVSNIAPKVIVDQVSVAGRGRRVFRQACKVNRDLIAQKGRTLYVPKRGQITAETGLSEGAGPTSDAGKTYTTATVSVQKSGVKVTIGQESIDGSQFDVINDHINEAGEALAEAEDKYIRDKFVASGANGLTVNAAGTGTLSYDDVIAARLGVMNGNFTPKLLIIHPDQEADLLKDTKFIDASKYGDRGPILNAEIGRFAGLTVLATTNMSTGSALVVDPDRAAYLAIKRDLELKRKDEPSTDDTQMYFYQEYGASIVEASASALITNC